MAFGILLNLLFATHFFVKLHVFIHGCLMVWPDLYFFLLSYKTQKVVLCEKSDLHETGSAELGGPHKGINLPKRFTNLSVLDSSGPQNEKRLSYRKQKSCLGSKLNFVFYTCLPHFTLGLTILVDIRKVRQVYVVISVKC